MGAGRRSGELGGEEENLSDWLLPVTSSRDTIVSVGKFARVGVRKNIIRSWIQAKEWTLRPREAGALSRIPPPRITCRMNKNVDIER